MATSRAGRTLALLSLSTAGLAAQLLVPCPGGSFLWSALFDAGHVVVYGLVALALLGLLRARSRGPSPSAYSPFVPDALALAITTALGATTEGVQALGLGDASFGDLGRDILGGVGFLLASIAFARRGCATEPLNADPRVAPRRMTGLLARCCAALGALLALTVALAPIAGTVLAYVQRNAAFPLLCSFDQRWERTFVRAGDQAVLDRAAPPAAWVRSPEAAAPSSRPRSDLAGRLTFHPGDYPGLVVHELFPDWRGYDRLVFDAYSELDSTVSLELRLNDARHDNAWADRFNRILPIHPGANRIEISLDEVRNAPRGRAMEMESMRTLVLFAPRPARTFSIWLDDLRLE